MVKRLEPKNKSASLNEVREKTYALIYCRVSSERQRTEGHGLDAQEARCREYSEEKNLVIQENYIYRERATGAAEASVGRTSPRSFPPAAPGAAAHRTRRRRAATALRRAGARKIISVIPWLGYSLQDKMLRLGEPIAAKVIADFISREVRRHILVNLHSDSIAGFFPVPASQVSAMEMFAQYAKKKGIDNAVVVSPDFGAIKRARAFAQMLDVSLMHINKERDRVTGEITVHGMSDTAEGKTCLVIDDVVSTGGTLVETAHILKKSKAATVRFFSTHALLVGDAHTKLAASPLDELVVSDTVVIPAEKRFKNLTILSIAPILAPEIKIWI